jgi:hypothetical protein
MTDEPKAAAPPPKPMTANELTAALAANPRFREVKREPPKPLTIEERTAILRADPNCEIVEPSGKAFIFNAPKS